MRKVLLGLAGAGVFVLILPGILFTGAFFVVMFMFMRYASSVESTLSRSTILDRCYANDKGRILEYVKSSTTPRITYMTADASTFVPMSSAADAPCLGKDASHVFFRDQAIRGADPKTYTIISATPYSVIGRDRTAVYWDTQPVAGIDPLSASVVSSRFLKDASHVYRYSVPDGFSVLSGADPATFRIYPQQTFTWARSATPQDLCGDGKTFYSCMNGNEVDGRDFKFR